MKYPKINLAKLLKNYASGWVAISDDFKRVLFHGKTLKEITKKTKPTGKKVYYFPAGEKYSDYFG